jgi:putative ABC transport system permease protein
VDTVKAPRLFRLLLAFFPREFRESFGTEMGEVFFAQLCEARRRGRAATLSLWIRTLAGMSAAAWRERFAWRDRGRRTVGLPWHETLAADIRLAGRLLLRAPLFAAIVIGTIAIGVGGVATIFSALNALVLRPLPGTSDGTRLVLIERRSPDASEGVSASNAFYRYLAATAHAFDGVAAWSRVSLSIARAGQGFSASGNIVSGNYFAVLGVRPALGRFFLPEDDSAPLGHPVVVVSYAFWKNELAGDPSIVGGVVAVNGRPYHLIGVAPAGFHGVFTPIRVDAWVPLAMQPHVRPGRDLQRNPWLWSFGRLRDGVDAAQARAETSALTRAWTSSGEDASDFHRYTNIRLTPLTGLPDDARRALLAFGGLLLAASLLVTVIAGTNVSSLLSARALARRRETGVRMALGATRGRVVRQLLTETLVLFVLGALGAMVVAQIATAALERLPLPADAALTLELAPDGRVLAVSIAVGLLLGVLFGIGPALLGVARAPGTLLQANSARSGRRSTASALVIVTQVACSLVLLTVAGLFARAVAAGMATDPRLDPTGVVIAGYDTVAYGYDEANGRAFYDALRRRLERAPGVERVSFGTFVPLTFANIGGTAALDATPTAAARQMPVGQASVDGDYLAVMGIPLIVGREFSNADVGVRVAIVNETFVRRAWADGNVLGRTFVLDGRRVTVIGVARDSHYARLDEPSVPFVYLPLAERWVSARTLFVRGRSVAPPPPDLIARETLAIDSSLPRPIVSTLTHEMSVVLLPQRVAALITALLGTLGLMLAGVGLYGLVAYSVSLRTREIGVRMALGATAIHIIRLVLTGGIWLIAAGTTVGIGVSLLITRLLEGYLLNVNPLDPATFIGAASVLLAVTMFASYVPARRAARVSPGDILAREVS